MMMVAAGVLSGASGGGCEDSSVIARDDAGLALTCQGHLDADAVFLVDACRKTLQVDLG